MHAMKMSSHIRDCIRVLRDALWWWWDILCEKFSRSQRVSRDGTLFVKLDAIGDFVIWYGSLIQYRQAHQDEPLYIACTPSVASLIRATRVFDEVISIKHASFIRNLIYRRRVLQQIRRLCARRAIQATYTRRFILGDSVTLHSGAQEKVAYEGCPSLAGWRRFWADHAYTALVPRNAASFHEMEHNTDLMRFLDVPGAEAVISQLPQVVQLPPSLIFEKPYFVVFPGAGSVKRCWPVDRFGALGKWVAERQGWQMVVCGALDDKELGEALLQSVADVDGVNLCGKSSLPEFVEVVRGASLLVGNETSAVHIAAAVETPSVCLLGGGHYGRFMPYSPSISGMKPVPVYDFMKCFGCDWHCVHPDQLRGQATPCVEAIRVEAVIEAVHKILK